MAILNKYKKKWKSLLNIRKDRYYDLVLSLENDLSVIPDNKLVDRCLIAYIDTNRSECALEDGALASISDYSYGGAVNNGVKLENIGLTGIDTSLVKFDVDSATTDSLIGTIENHTLSVESGDTRLILTPVTGNTQQYEYPAELVSEDSGDTYYKLTGGFLQGFYKTCDGNYEVLPNNPCDVWNMEFVIRPRSDYDDSGETSGDTSGQTTGETSGDTITLNQLYPNNKGIFFYMGTRAENKFIEQYNCDLSMYPLRDASGETSGDTASDNPVVKTKDGHTVEAFDEIDITTDNGYLIYDRTESGDTVATWNQGDSLQITMQDRQLVDNLFLLMNRTESGQTVSTLEKYLEDNPDKVVNKKCNILTDILNNAFALKVNDDGSIGYKYAIRDCDSEKGYKIQEENSFPNIVKDGEWNVIHVMFKVMNGSVDNCCVPFGERTMKMYIYVNGYLKLVSQELPEFNFRALNDYCDKQEAVAYNISLGGGTQGLLESIWFDSYKGSKHIFPIEENFTGTFIGDLRSFKFYECQLQYQEIKNNYNFEMSEK